MTGFSAQQLAAADSVLRSGHQDQLWPGIVAAVGTGRTIDREWVIGWAEHWPGGHRDMTADTVFDLASLTKVLATLPAVLLLVQRGELGLDDIVADFVSGLDSRVRVRHLLTHSSGLPAHRDFSERASSPAALAAAAAATPLEQPPQTRVAYSDLGFVLLGALVQSVSGLSLGEFAEREVFAPLGSAATFTPPADWLPRIAATELVDGRPVHGTVHDENAAAAGGPVGHAGLFATAADVRACLPVWFPHGALLDDQLRAEALRDTRSAWAVTAAWAGRAAATCTTSFPPAGETQRSATPASPGRASPSTRAPCGGRCC